MALLLLLTSGLPLMTTGRLLADEPAPETVGCEDRLSRIERGLAGSGLGAHRQEQIRLVIDGARTLDQLGDGERCNGLADQLDRLLARLSAADGAKSGSSVTPAMPRGSRLMAGRRRSKMGWPGDPI